MIATEITTGISGINWNTIILGILSVIGTGVSGIIAIYVAKAQQLQKEAKEEVKAVKADLAVATAETMHAMEGTSGKLDVIHALSNSALTASMESDENSQTLNIVMMEEMLKSSGKEPSKEAMEALTKAKGRVEELRRAIAERKAQQNVINEKIAAGQKSGPVHVMIANTEKNAVPVDPVTKEPA